MTVRTCRQDYAKQRERMFGHGNNHSWGKYVNRRRQSRGRGESLGDGLYKTRGWVPAFGLVAKVEIAAKAVIRGRVAPTNGAPRNDRHGVWVSLRALRCTQHKLREAISTSRTVKITALAVISTLATRTHAKTHKKIRFEPENP